MDKRTHEIREHLVRIAQGREGFSDQLDMSVMKCMARDHGQSQLIRRYLLRRAALPHNFKGVLAP